MKPVHKVQKQPPEVFYKKAVLQTFAIFAGKHLRWSPWLVKLQAWACNFIKKRLQHRCFPVNIAEFLRIAIFIEHIWWLFERRVIILKQLQVASAAFLRCSFRKIFLNSWSIGRIISTVEGDLSWVAPATLLLALSVVDNFLKILQEFKQNSFQDKKQL